MRMIEINALKCIIWPQMLLIDKNIFEQFKIHLKDIHELNS